MKKIFQTIGVPGGAGYVGSKLVPALLEEGYRVKVLDAYFFGDDALAHVANNPNLQQVKGDVRDIDVVKDFVRGCDAIIHFACISNDPSVELDPDLSKSINYDSFRPFVLAAKEAGVKRFIFAASSSVYGVSDAPQVTEDHPHLPITAYNKYKSMCEQVLWEEQTDAFIPVSVRPATVCGYAPRLRLDLTVNILTSHAYHKGEITVFGGDQMRPNIHIDDLVDLYLQLLVAPSEKIAGQAFNAGYENHTVRQLAEIVRDTVSERFPDIKPSIVFTDSDDVRSYHISSEKVARAIGFVPKRDIADAVHSLLDAFEEGRVPGALESDRYSNVRTMKELQVPVAY